MRRFVAPRTFVCIAILAVLLGLGLGLSLGGAGPSRSLALAAAPAPSAPSGDIRDYIVGHYTDPYKPYYSDDSRHIFLYSGEAWVVLKGPVVISVFVADNGQTSTQTVTIPDGKTYSVKGPGPTTGTNQWNATITLASVGPVSTTTTADERALMQLVFGGDAAANLEDYIKKHTDEEARQATGKFADKAAGMFSSGVEYRDPGAPNLADAAKTFRQIAYLITLKDQTTGEPLFPVLQHARLQAVLRQLTRWGASDGQALGAATVLTTLVCRWTTASTGGEAATGGAP